ncbi:MAG: glycosyltransferase [Desulfamplus sp.]|nr:glycosyltransferase [Desulfamplus sp.]
MDKRQNPEISIVMRTKNRASLLREGLESILAVDSLLAIEDQKYHFFEVIVVNDGGACVENIVDEVLTGKIPYIYINIKDSVGRSAAGNSGVNSSSAPWVFFLDDDDLLLSEGIKEFIEIIKNGDSPEREIHNEPVVYHGKVKALRYSSNGFSGELFKIFSTPFNADAILWENHIPINALIIPRSLFLEIGGFDSSFSCFEDWDLLLRLSDHAKLIFLPFFTAVYRIFDHSFIVGGGGEQWQDKGRAELYLKHWHRYSPDKMVEIYKAVNKEMRGEFLPEMTLLKEEVKKFQQERSTWTEMDKDRETYIKKLENDIINIEQKTRLSQQEWEKMDKDREAYINRLEGDIRNLEQGTRSLQQEWEKMDKDREIYIKKLENEIKKLENETIKLQKDWETMDKERVDYVNDLLRHIQSLENDIVQRQKDREVMEKESIDYVNDLLKHIQNLEMSLGIQEKKQS